MLSTLMRLWGCSADRAEHIIRNDEQHARLVVSRRAFFGAAAALTAPNSVIDVPVVGDDPFIVRSLQHLFGSYPPGSYPYRRPWTTPTLTLLPAGIAYSVFGGNERRG